MSNNYITIPKDLAIDIFNSFEDYMASDLYTEKHTALSFLTSHIGELERLVKESDG